MIGTALVKREETPSPDLSAVGITTEVNKLAATTEESSVPVVNSVAGSPEKILDPLLNAQGAPDGSTNADVSTAPETVAQELAPLPLEPVGGLVDPTVPVAPITDAPVFPEPPKDSPQAPTPTYPNLPIAVEEEVKKKPTPGEIFAKYAAAGAGILSTIGVGVGGLLGGVVGGAVGLVLGLVLAAVNASFYA
ncbi:hypothetical protein BGZ72_006337 [Mortierella alpina]|nr:hypothetical protein BGZ72_006337 [Mortierella alpina]